MQSRQRYGTKFGPSKVHFRLHCQSTLFIRSNKSSMQVIWLCGKICGWFHCSNVSVLPQKATTTTTTNLLQSFFVRNFYLIFSFLSLTLVSCAVTVRQSYEMKSFSETAKWKRIWLARAKNPNIKITSWRYEVTVKKTEKKSTHELSSCLSACARHRTAEKKKG